MAKSVPSTIVRLHNQDGINQFERTAASTITPGDLVEINSSNKAQRHSTAEGPAVKFFAKENDLVGEEIDKDYAADDRVLMVAARSGDVLLVNIADGENITKGDFLESDGSGRLQKYTNESGGLQEFPIAQALEDVDLSGSAGADPSFRIDAVII